MAAPIALIAGEGALPVRLLQVCAAQGRRVIVCGVFGHDRDLPRNDMPLRLETLGTTLDELKAHGVAEVCFCGAVQPPRIDPALIDAATAPLVERMVGAVAAGGDDAALRIAIELFEDAGFYVRAATDLVPELLPAEGVPSQARPSDAHGADAGRAAAVVAGLGALDIGQGCVVRQGRVLAVEAAPGTDWMLQSLAAHAPAGQGGLLYKAPKPGQDRRVDLPAIGPATVRGAQAAGLDGIAIALGGVMVLDLPATVAEADAAGLFLWIRRGAQDTG